MTKKKNRNKQATDTDQAAPTPAASHDSVKDTAKLMAGGIIIAAAVCVVLIVVIVTQKKTPVMLPVMQQQVTGDGGPDMYGRSAEDEHYGHTHP